MKRSISGKAVALLFFLLSGLAGLTVAGKTPSTGSLYVFKEQVVEDTQARVFWTRNANLAENPMSWDDARDYVDTLNKKKFAGYADWQLPDVNDLARLAAAAGRAANVKTFSETNTVAAALEKMGFRNVQAANYWTSTNSMFNDIEAWYYSLSSGNKAIGNKSLYRSVWPVRRQK